MRRIPLLTSALILPLTASFSACADPLRITATEPVFSATLQVYAFSQAPPAYPAGISILFGRAVPVSVMSGFDLALDISDDGRAVIYTPRALVNPLAGVRPMGLLHVGGFFEDLLSAPQVPYAYDSLLTVSVGEVVVVESNRSGSGDLCSFALASNIYAKLRVSFIDEVTSAMTVDLTVNPNCGFRSFEPGIPQN